MCPVKPSKAFSSKVEVPFAKRNEGSELSLFKKVVDNSVLLAVYDPQHRGVSDKINHGNEGERQKGHPSLTQISAGTIPAHPSDGITPGGSAMSVKSLWAPVSAVLMILLFSVPTQAADDPDFISFSVGRYDQDWINPDFLFLNGDNGGNDGAVDYRLEYRFGTSLISWTEPYVKIKPFIGFEGTSEWGAYGLGGILADIPIGPLTVTPSFGIGLYSQGDGRDLGSLLEFRSQVELGYRFENEIRISVAYSHISNANLTELNPGVDIVSAYLHVPVKMITKLVF
jgi:lipid A 3-O-deacylase